MEINLTHRGMTDLRIGLIGRFGAKLIAYSGEGGETTLDLVPLNMHGEPFMPPIQIETKPND